LQDDLRRTHRGRHRGLTRSRPDRASDRLPGVGSHRRGAPFAPGTDALGRWSDARGVSGSLPSRGRALATAVAASRSGSGLGLRVWHLRPVHAARPPRPRSARARAGRCCVMGAHRSACDCRHARRVRPDRRACTALSAEQARTSDSRGAAARCRSRPRRAANASGGCSWPAAALVTHASFTGIADRLARKGHRRRTSVDASFPRIGGTTPGTTQDAQGGAGARSGICVMAGRLVPRAPASESSGNGQAARASASA
jgi:hypothetical protein